MTFVLGVILNYVIFIAKIVRNTGVFIVIHNKTFITIWKKFWNPILSSGMIQWIVAIVFSIPIWFVYFTSRREIRGIDVLKDLNKKPAIFVFWHGRSMMLSPVICTQGIKSYAITSRHKDGRMMAKLQRLFGLKAIYGSTSSGGISVLRQGVRVISDEKWSICMSPDGPSGPSMRVQDGALYFAKMTGAPIIPVCYSVSKPWFQKRWDRYLVALPFSKIVCKIGKPIFVDSKVSSDEFEKIRKNLENIMVKQVRDLDGEFNLFKVEQDQTAGEFKKMMRESKKK
jgi:lysophospholipid acyltransferase (LPLAT)-like uncharacterized protein